MNSAQHSVTVMGLGPMGRAMAAALLDRGYAVTVWNRTASRAGDLLARGRPSRRAPPKPSRRTRWSSSASRTTRRSAPCWSPPRQALDGRVLLNLTSATPEEARAGARWAAGHGAVQLTGGVNSPPSGIGQPESSTFYSGPREVFDRHRAVLVALTGRAEHHGEDPGRAALLYQLGVGMFWTAMLGYWQAVALARANGLTAADFLPHADDTANSLAQFFAFYADRIDAGVHVGDVDRLAMGMASVEHVLQTNADAGSTPPSRPLSSACSGGAWRRGTARTASRPWWSCWRSPGGSASTGPTDPGTDGRVRQDGPSLR